MCDHSRRNILFRGPQDLDAPDSVAAPVPVTPREPDGGAEPMMLVVTEGARAKKKDTPATRIKELQTKGNLTDKEKKELRRLKSEEVRALRLDTGPRGEEIRRRPVDSHAARRRCASCWGAAAEPAWRSAMAFSRVRTSSAHHTRLGRTFPSLCPRLLSI